MMTKIPVPISWTKHLMSVHPVVFITTVGQVRKKHIAGIAPFATCLDTSYEPPYITFSAAIHQHSVIGHPANNGRMNTYVNIKQNGMFIINIPGKDLLNILDIVAFPYEREKYVDKMELAGLTKLPPFYFPNYPLAPPLVGECLAHIECFTIDIHRPKQSDHWLITGKVVACSYDSHLGKELDTIRQSLVQLSWHHFGSSTNDATTRFISSSTAETRSNSLIFRLEKKINY